MPKNLGTSNKGAISAMFGALTLLFLRIACILPVFLVLPAVLFSGIFIGGVMAEEETFKAIIMFVCCSVLGIFVTGGFVVVVPYILFSGWYGLAKPILENMRDKVISYCLKFILFNGMMVLTYLLAPVLFAPYISIPVYVSVIIAQAAFLLFDGAIWLFATTYLASVKRFL